MPAAARTYAFSLPPTVTHTIANSTELLEALDHSIPKTTAAPRKPAETTVTGLANAFSTAANITRTENGAKAFHSTGDPVLDLFTGISAAKGKKRQHPGEDPLCGSELDLILGQAWNNSPELTIKLIFYLRSILDGAGERLLFYRAAAWLLRTHPRSLIGNLSALVTNAGPPKRVKKKGAPKQESDLVVIDMDDLDADGNEDEVDFIEVPGRLHGSYKDLLNIVLLAAKELDTDLSMEDLALAGKMPAAQPPKKKSKKISVAVQDIAQTHRARIAGRPAAVEQRLSNNATFALLYRQVVQLFARQLRLDEQNTLASEHAKKTKDFDAATRLEATVTYAAKWAPNEGNSVDEQTGLAGAIAATLYGSTSGFALKEYRKLLVRLRAFKKVPEQKMHGKGNKSWTGISYANLPSRCFDINRAHFAEHDVDGYRAFLTKVAAGGASIAGAALGPTDLVAKAYNHVYLETLSAKVKEDQLILNAQWDSMVKVLKEEIEGVRRTKGAEVDSLLPSTGLAMVDVSGSMMGCYGGAGTVVPMHAAIALGLLLTTLSGVPWRGKLLPFDSNPTMIDLSQKMDLDAPLQFSNMVREVARIPAGYSTDLNKAFDAVLDIAKRAGLQQQETRIRIVVFSDMQFDEADGAYKEMTTLDVIRAKYAAAGYDMPKIVFWNLAGDYRAAKPAIAQDPDVICLSGFSGAAMKALLDGTIDEVAAEQDNEFEQLKKKAEEEKQEQEQKAEKEKKLQEVSPRRAMKKILDRESFQVIRLWE